MRRLFSTFAQGWPGCGLLILRLVAAAAAVGCGFQGLIAAQSTPAALYIAAIIAGVLLSIGLWTPVAGCLVAAVALWSLIMNSGDAWRNILMAGMGIALSMIGPGAWSLDARLFGWRRILIREREDGG
jgi:putative oxidoreductase